MCGVTQTDRKKKKKQERKRHIGESDSSVSLCVIWFKNSQGWITAERSKEGKRTADDIFYCAQENVAERSRKNVFIAGKGLGQTLSDNTAEGFWKVVNIFRVATREIAGFGVCLVTFEFWFVAFTRQSAATFCGAVASCGSAATATDVYLKNLDTVFFFFVLVGSIQMF